MVIKHHTLENRIIVLGMHRSGTSLVAELIHEWGAHTGDKEQMLPADEWNERGYWEYMPLLIFNDDLLASVDSTWLAPPPIEDERLLEARASEPELRDSALRLMREMENSSESSTHCWFWKDPRLGITLPFWKQLWGNPIYLVLVRNPLDLALSLQRRFHFPLSASLLLWQRYVLTILKHAGNSERVLFIQYEQLLRDPRPQCARISDFLTKQSGLKQAKHELLEGMVRAVRPGLRHNISSENFSEIAIASSEQKKLYNLMKRRVDEPSAEFAESAYGMYPGWREYLLTIELLQQWWIKFQQRADRQVDEPSLPFSESSRRVLGL